MIVSILDTFLVLENNSLETMAVECNCKERVNKPTSWFAHSLHKYDKTELKNI